MMSVLRLENQLTKGRTQEHSDEIQKAWENLKQNLNLFKDRKHDYNRNKLMDKLIETDKKMLNFFKQPVDKKSGNSPPKQIHPIEEEIREYKLSNQRISQTLQTQLIEMQQLQQAIEIVERAQTQMIAEEREYSRKSMGLDIK